MERKLLNAAKALRTLRKTSAMLDMLLAAVTPEQARTLREGADGWSILFVVCHMHQYEASFAQRVGVMLAQDNPTLPPWPSDAAERQRACAQDDLPTVLADIRAQRRALITQLESLTDEQWQRPGIHLEQGPATVLDVALNAGVHDVDHLEQIMRCLPQYR